MADELREFLRTHTPEKIAKYQHYDKEKDMCFIVLPSGKRWRFYMCIYCSEKDIVRTKLEEWIIALLIDGGRLEETTRNNGRICRACFKEFITAEKLKRQKAIQEKERLEREKQAEKEKKYTIIYGED